MALISINTENTKLRETVQYLTDNIGGERQITPMLIDDICDAIEKGASPEVASNACGIGWQTLISWLGEGNKLIAKKENTNLLAILARRVAQLDSKREIRSLKRLDAAGEGGALLYERTTTRPDGTVVSEKKYTSPNPTVDMWYLERKHPTRWGRVDTVRGTIEHTVKSLTDADLDEKIQSIIGKITPGSISADKPEDIVEGEIVEEEE